MLINHLFLEMSGSSFVLFFADLVWLGSVLPTTTSADAFFALICTMFFHHQKKWWCMFVPLLFSRKLHVFLFPLLRFMLLCLQIMNRICVLLHTHTYDTRRDDHIHNNTTFSEYKRKPEVETQIFTNIYTYQPALQDCKHIFLAALLIFSPLQFLSFLYPTFAQHSLLENNNQQQNTIMINIIPVWFSLFLLFSSRVNIIACVNQLHTTRRSYRRNFPVLLRRRSLEEWANKRKWMNEKWFTFQITLHLRLSIYISFKQ